MNLLDIFRRKPKKSAEIAKERLKIILAQERNADATPNYLPMLQKEILAVIAKYIKVEADQVQVNLQNSGDFSVLELNITLPEKEEAAIAE